MLRRFLIFGFGLVLGCILVYFIFIKNRDTSFRSWLPSSIIKNELIKTLDTTSINKCYWNCVGIEINKVEQFISNANILFEKSKPNLTPKIYILQGKNRSGTCIEIGFALQKVHSEITGVQACRSELTCNCL